MNQAYEALMNAPVEDVARMNMRIITELQNEYRKPGVQIAAVASTFLLLCDRFKIEPQDAFLASKKIMATAEEIGRPEFRAVREYLKHEVR